MSRETNDSNRTSFVFYESFFTAIDKMELPEQLPIYKAIAEYALYRKDPDFTGIGEVVWSLIKPQLDANWKRYENGVKGGEYGSKGGAPKGNTNARKRDKQPQNNPETTPNVNVNDNVNENNNENIGGNKRTAKRFTPPSFSEVSEYITQKGYTINPQSFIDFYTSNGWRVGKNPMKNWRAAVSSWNSRDDGNRSSTVQTPQKSQQYDEL